MDAEEIRRRVRAARAYAGLSLDGLTARVELGRNTLVRIESGERNPKAMEVRAIAEACGVPAEFFYIDFDQLPEMVAAHSAEEAADVVAGGDPFVELAGKVDNIEEMLWRVLRVGRLVGPDGQVVETDPGLGELDPDASDDEIVAYFRTASRRLIDRVDAEAEQSRSATSSEPGPEPDRRQGRPPKGA